MTPPPAASPPPSFGARVRGQLPTVAVVLALAAYGAWVNGVGLANPEAIGPRTHFTPGQYLAAAIAEAQWRSTGTFATTTPLLGWPDVAEFRVVMWPTQLVAVLVGALPAVNLAFAFAPALNAVAGAILGGVLGLGPWQRATLAGLAAWSPWVRETLVNGQMEQVVVGVVALQWAVALLAARRFGVVRLALVPLVTWGVAMTAPHLCLAACLGLGGWAAGDLLVAWRARGSAGRSLARHAGAWLVVLALSGAAALVANRYHSPNFTGGVQVFFPKGSDGHPTGLAGLPEQATLWSLLLPPATQTGEINVLHPNYLGWAALLAAGVGLVRGWRARAYGAALAAGVLVLLAGFSLGTEMEIGTWKVPGPYALLGLVSQAVAQSGSAYRVVGAATVALAVAAAYVAPSARVAIPLLLAAWAETTLVATRPLPFLPMDFTPDPVVAPFRAGEGAILDLPMIGQECPITPYHYVFEATRRLRPTPILPAAPGFYPTIPGLQTRVQSAIASATCGADLAELVPGIGFTAVVLHLHDPSCRVSRRLQRCLGEAFGEGVTEGGVRYWDPLPPPPSGAAPGAAFPTRPPPPGQPGSNATPAASTTAPPPDRPPEAGGARP